MLIKSVTKETVFVKLESLTRPPSMKYLADVWINGNSCRLAENLKLVPNQCQVTRPYFSLNQCQQCQKMQTIAMTRYFSLVLSLSLIRYHGLRTGYLQFHHESECMTHKWTWPMSNGQVSQVRRVSHTLTFLRR